MTSIQDPDTARVPYVQCLIILSTVGTEKIDIAVLLSFLVLQTWSDEYGLMSGNFTVIFPII